MALTYPAMTKICPTSVPKPQAMTTAVSSKPAADQRQTAAKSTGMVAGFGVLLEKTPKVWTVFMARLCLAIADRLRTVTMAS
jgi:hypothetical protein